jgi:hypothetical protein
MRRPTQSRGHRTSLPGQVPDHGSEKRSSRSASHMSDESCTLFRLYARSWRSVAPHCYLSAACVLPVAALRCNACRVCGGCCTGTGDELLAVLRSAQPYHSRLDSRLDVSGNAIVHVEFDGPPARACVRSPICTSTSTSDTRTQAQCD